MISFRHNLHPTRWSSFLFIFSVVLCCVECICRNSSIVNLIFQYWPKEPLLSCYGSLLSLHDLVADISQLPLFWIFDYLRNCPWFLCHCQGVPYATARCLAMACRLPDMHVLSSPVSTMQCLVLVTWALPQQCKLLSTAVKTTKLCLFLRVSIQKQQLLISTRFAICLHWLEGAH